MILLTNPTRYITPIITRRFYSNLKPSTPDIPPILPKPSASYVTARAHIHDALYHPITGYFQSRVTIFNNPSDIPFNELKDTQHFSEHIGKVYEQFDPILKTSEAAKRNNPESNQRGEVWHTPVEIFRVKLEIILRIT